MAKADVCDMVGGLHCWGRQNAVVSKKRIKWRKDTFHHFLDKKPNNLTYFGNKNLKKTDSHCGLVGSKKTKSMLT